MSQYGHSVTRKTMKTAHGAVHGGRHFRTSLWSRRIALACGAAMVLGLTGCLEIDHHVTMTDSRTVGTVVKVGIARQMMEMAQAFAEHEMAMSDSCNSIIGSGEHLANRLTDDLVPGARVVQLETIDTDTECGILFHFELDTLLLRWLGDETIPFLVSIRDDRVEIFLPGMGDGRHQDELTLAFLAPLKYRLTVSKTLMEYTFRPLMFPMDTASMGSVEGSNSGRLT